MKSNKKQVVFIMTDTQGVNMLGCYGRPEMQTPNLDKMAVQGVRFEKAYTASPLCGPARSAIFTGTYPHTNGCWANEMPVGDNLVNVGQRLNDNGIHCGYVGKWHLSGSDYFGTGICPDYFEDKYWYDMKRYLDEMPSDEIRTASRKEMTPELVDKYNMDENFTYAHKCSDKGIEFLAENADKDFFLTVSYDEPHEPFICPKEYYEKFKDFRYKLGDNYHDNLKDKPEQHRKVAEGLKEWGAKAVNEDGFWFPACFAANNYVDYEIGRLLDEIEKQAPNALVIFTSDHGDQLFAHGMHGKGPYMYDESNQIPFLVKWGDNIPAAKVAKHPVSHIDITPTLLDYYGLDIPPFLQGQSILNDFKEPEKQEERSIFAEFNRFDIAADGIGGLIPIRSTFDGRYKLVINLFQTDELYDQLNDPGEITNLIDSEEHCEVRNKLHQQILDWMNETLDPFRGELWINRYWKKEKVDIPWGKTAARYRLDDGYLPPVRQYSTGLEWE